MPNAGFQGRSPSSFARLFDAGSICGAHWLALSLREGYGVSPGLGYVTVLAAATFCLVGHVTGLYPSRLRSPSRRSELANVWQSWALSVALLLAAAVVTKTSDDHSRVLALTWFLLAPLFMSLVRAARELSTVRAA